MLPSHALDRLYEHQTDILDIMNGAEALVKGTRDVAGIARARWALMRALTAYQLFKHREIFDPALAKARLRTHCRPSQKMTVAAMAMAEKKVWAQRS